MKKKLSLLFLSLILFSKTQSMMVEGAPLPSFNGFMATFLCPIICVACSVVGCMAAEDYCCTHNRSDHSDNYKSKDLDRRDQQVRQAGYNPKKNS